MYIYILRWIWRGNCFPSMTAPLVFEPRPAGTIQKRNETIPSTGNRISLRGNRPALGAHVAEYDFIRQSGA